MLSFVELSLVFTIAFLLNRKIVCDDMSGPVLDVHNKHRSHAGLTPMSWSSSLASEAQAYNDKLTGGKCSLIHSNAKGKGENLYMVTGSHHTGSELGKSSSTSWYNEISKYKYPDDAKQSFDTCVSFHAVGHFTQMMWSKSTKVGCGFGKCAHKDAFIVTCQYQPSGNVIGMPMFSIDNYNKLIASGESMARCSDADNSRNTVVGDMSGTVLAVHNSHRSNAGLQPLSWSGSLAGEAQSYNDQLTGGSCSMIHSGASGKGENLYMITGSSYSDSDLGDKASSSWYSEIEDYEYPSDPAQTFDLCVDFEDVGHFTQMMWSATTEVGCGFGKCSSQDTFMVTCQYKPAGNMKGEPMFAIENYDKLIASGEEMDRCSAPDNLIAAFLVMGPILAKAIF
ncbi:ancylostoma secreted protein-like [Convolutriloba macropyga]|uniref:ancylostoma secreted protein-like n=1 Tax=Convolutriloba macropyga TaxID=536237 RepID=UPI003F523B4A